MHYQSKKSFKKISEVKQVFYVKPLQDGEYGIFDRADELVLSGERESISQQLAQASGMRFIEAISIIDQLDKGRAHVSVILNPYFLKDVLKLL